MVSRVQPSARMANTPVICDGDTGYGGLLNVAHTVRGYERAGASAIQLEDQEFPEEVRPHAGPARDPARGHGGQDQGGGGSPHAATIS